MLVSLPEITIMEMLAMTKLGVKTDVKNCSSSGRSEKRVQPLIPLILNKWGGGVQKLNLFPTHLSGFNSGIKLEAGLCPYLK